MGVEKDCDMNSFIETRVHQLRTGLERTRHLQLIAGYNNGNGGDVVYCGVNPPLKGHIDKAAVDAIVGGLRTIRNELLGAGRYEDVKQIAIESKGLPRVKGF